jgi:hypothetical protein
VYSEDSNFLSENKSWDSSKIDNGLQTAIRKLRLHPNVAKAEDAADARRQG